jgi:O-antigen ligase
MTAIADWFRNSEERANPVLAHLMAAIFLALPLGTTPPTLCGIAAALVWIGSGRFVSTLGRVVRRRWFRPVILWILLPWIGLLYTPDFFGEGMNYAGKTHYWIYGMVLAAVIGRLSFRWLMAAFFLGLACNALVGTLQLAGLVAPKGDGWFTGLGRGYSVLSALLMVGILMASRFARWAGHSRERLGLWALAGFFFFHLVILQGRTGYVTFAVLSPMVVRNIADRMTAFRTVLVCATLVGLMLLSPVVRDRVNLSVRQIRHHLEAPPDEAWGRVYTVHQDRFFMWYGAARIFLDHPVRGVGTGGYRALMKARFGDEAPEIAHPHNDLLYMAVSFGVFGIVAFFWLFGEMLRNGWRERDAPAGYFVLSSTLVILVSGLLNAQTLDARMAFLLALTAGTQERLSDRSAEKTRPRGRITREGAKS